MKKSGIKIFVILTLVISALVHAQTDSTPSTYLNTDNNYGAFTPRDFLNNGEEINIANGNLFMQWRDAVVKGRSGMELGLTRSLNAGSTEIVIEEFTRLFEGAVNHYNYPTLPAGEAGVFVFDQSFIPEGNVDRIVYDPKTIVMPGLGRVTVTGAEDHVTTPQNRITYDPEEAGWDVAWAPFRGVVVFTDVTPNRASHSRHVYLVKAGGSIEAFNAQTGLSWSRNTGNVLLHDLLTDANPDVSGHQDPIVGLNELRIMDRDGREYKFVHEYNDSLTYKATYVHRCGMFWDRDDCYDDYDNLIGWKVDAFILDRYSDANGNTVIASPRLPVLGENQRISLYNSDNPQNEWKAIERRLRDGYEEWISPGDAGDFVWTIFRDGGGRITRTVDPEGNTTTFGYDPAAGFGVFPRTRQRGMDLLINPTNFVQIQYPTGGIIRYEFFADINFGEGFVKNVIVTEIPNVSDSSNVRQRYYEVINSGTRGENVSQAARTSVTLEDGSTVNFTFDRVLGQLLAKNKVTTAGGRSISETYDWSTNPGAKAVNGIGRISVERDGSGYISSTASYDELGRVTSTNDALRNTTRYSYLLLPSDVPQVSNAMSPDVVATLRSANLVSSVSRSLAGGTYDNVFYYGGTDSCDSEISANLLKSVEKHAAGSVKVLNKFCYDDFGNITKIKTGDTEAPELDLNITYDASGVYRTSSQQGSNTTSYGYNSGRLASLSHPNGSSTRYQYDRIGRPTKIEFGRDAGSGFEVNYSVEHSYMPTTVITTIHDGSSSGDFVISRTYDGLGLLLSENKNGLVRQYGYDAGRRLSSITYGDGKTASLVYDGFGRLIYKQLPGLDPFSYSYELIKIEGLGLSDTINSYVRGRITQRKFYDLTGRLTGEAKYVGGTELVTNYDYDKLNNVTEISSPTGFSISNEYNYGNDTLVRTYPGGDRIEIEIGDAGNLMQTGRFDAAGGSVSTRFNYDAMNRFSGIDLPALGGREINDITVSYGGAGTNAEGRINEIRDYYGTTEFWYGGSGSTGGVERGIDSLGEEYKFNYSRDGFGNVEEVTYPHGLKVHYVRDNLRRVTEVRQGGTQGLRIAALSYNADGNVSAINYANGVTTNYVYDLAGRVSRITVHRGTNYISDEQYTYDGRGRKTRVVHLDGSKADYSYDDSNRLIKAEYFKNGVATAYDSQDFSYDADGNRITYRDSSKELRYENASNKLTAIYRNLPAGERQVASFEYALGSLTRQTETENGETILDKTFLFDNARQLMGVHVVDRKTGFETQSNYTYDYAGRRESATVDGETTYYGYGDDPDPLVEINDQGEVKAAYIYVGGLRVASIEGDSLKIFHSDELGNTLGVTDEDGVVTQTVRYDPFGNINFLNGPDDNNYLFAGKPYDRATGLIYFGARYYDPETGRYISPDPLAQGTNHYIYAGDNPLTNRDLFGLWFGGGMDGPGGDFGGWQNPESNLMPGAGMEGPGLDPTSAIFGGMAFNLFSSFLNIAGIQMPQVDMSDIGMLALSGIGGMGADKKAIQRKNNPLDVELSLGLWGRISSVFEKITATLERLFTFSGPRPARIGDSSSDTEPTGGTGSEHGSSNESDTEFGNNPVAAVNNSLPPSDNSFNQTQIVSGNVNPIAGPSYELQPAVSSGVGTYVPQPGLPRSTPAETSRWVRPPEYPTRPREAGGITEQPDKPSPAVQNQRAETNTTREINNAGDPVLLHSGELIQTNVDLKIPGVGIDYEFKRTYRSRISYNGPLGYNWDHNYNKRLVELSNGNIARYDGDARFDIYLKNADNSYATPAGRFDVLTKSADGYRIRDSHGLVSSYDTGGKIVSITDSNGNSLTFSYTTDMLSSVTDTTGRQIVYEYNSAGKLTNVTDHTGRSVNFSYDSNGDLISVSSPLIAPTTYAYSSGFALDRSGLNHNLVSVTDAKGQTYLYNEYSVFDRVTRQRFGEEGWFEFEYRELLPTGECVNASETDDVLYRTRVKDRSGNITVSDFNCQGNPLKVEEFTRGIRPNDPESFVTTYSYNVDGLVTQITYPEGDSVELEYERHDGLPVVSRLSAGNLARLTKVPDAERGGGAPLVTSFLYEPLYNKPVKIIDPRGEGLATWLWYDYQEGINAAGVSAAIGIDEGAFRVIYPYLSLGAGDINGDGSISQTGGNLILAQRPPAHDLTGISQQLIKRFQYNTRGQPTRSINEAGVATDYVYNDSGYLVQRAIDPGGLNITHAVTRNSVGEVTSYTDPRGNAERFTLDDGGRITESANAAGVLTRFGYDANYKLAQINRQNTNADGAVIAGNEWLTTSFEYDWLDKVILKRAEIAEGRSVITEYQYDLNENLTRVISPEGNSTSVSYDERDLAYQITKGFESPSASTTAINYDGDKNAVSVTDGLGNTTTYAYDGFNRRTGESDPRGTETAAAYDSASLITRTQKIFGGELLAQTDYTYDEAKRLIRRSEAYVSGGTITGRANYDSAYTPAGLVARGTDPTGGIFANTYDAAGRLLGITDPAGNQTVNTYDANGNLLTSSLHAATDITTSYEYDAVNRITRRLDNAGNAWNFRYDSIGNLNVVTDPSGTSTRAEYNGLGRVTRKINSIAGRDVITTFEWDDNSRLVSQVDPSGNETEFEYDAIDRRTATVMPDGERYTSQYNANSNVTLFTAPDGTQTHFYYDDAGALTRREYQIGPVSRGRDEFTRDGVGRMVRARSFKNDGTISADIEYDYNSLGGIVSETELGEEVASTRNLAGIRTAVSYPDDVSIIEARDPIGRISGIGRAISGDLAVFGYHDPIRKSSAAYQNGTVAAFGYNGAALLDAITWQKADGTEIASHSLAYDAAGKIVTDNTQNYTYDGLDRLTRDLSFEYTYDDANNFTRVTETAAGRETNFTSNNLNQYTAVGATAISYDDNGNVTNDERFEYAYNWRNQITNVYDVATGDVIADYEYDALGRRVSKFDHATGEGTRYIYDGWRLIEERESDGTLAASFIYSDLDEPVAMVRDGETYFYHYDTRGSIEAVTNAAGAVVEQYSYESYGKVSITDATGATLTASAIGNPFFFTGQVLDAETGLYYFRNRFYSPTLGRFIERDPIGYADGTNLYAYVGNDPINKTDPFGLLENYVFREQREALCGGQSNCVVDMTPGSPEEAMFQNAMAVGLGATIAAPLAAELVAVYGPVISTGIAMGIQSAASMASPYLNSIQTFAQTQAADIQNNGIVQYVYTHPEETYDFATEFVSSFLENIGEKTGLPPTPSYSGVMGNISGAIAGEFARNSANAIHDNLVNGQASNNNAHPKK